VGIRFKPGAAGDVFGVPLHELRDQRVPLSALPALPIADCAPQPEWRLEAMRSAVVGRLAQSGSPDPETYAIAGALRAGQSVSEVAWDLGLSERQLHRRSVAAFGYAPKTLQRIVRFQRALRLARAGVPLAEVAVTAGYTDQAHLSHDVKRLSGVPMRHLVSPVRELA
jgi:AraC-like DNA-binding protein